MKSSTVRRNKLMCKRRDTTIYYNDLLKFTADTQRFVMVNTIVCGLIELFDTERLKCVYTLYIKK